MFIVSCFVKTDQEQWDAGCHIGSIQMDCYGVPGDLYHNTPFFELSYVLLTSHAFGLEEATKKFQRYRQ